MIYIEDNLFDDIEEFFSVLGNFNLIEKTSEVNWQGSRSEPILLWNKKAYDLVLNKMIEKFDVLKNKNFEKVDMGIHLRADDYINPHIDDSDYNCLVYLKGEMSQFNGTGFYTKQDGVDILNATVGFQPNRAILFKGNKLHACLNSLGENINIDRNRYTLNTFFYEGTA